MELNNQMRTIGQVLAIFLSWCGPRGGSSSALILFPSPLSVMKCKICSHPRIMGIKDSLSLFFFFKLLYQLQNFDHFSCLDVSRGLYQPLGLGGPTADSEIFETKENKNGRVAFCGCIFLCPFFLPPSPPP